MDLLLPAGLPDPQDPFTAQRQGMAHIA
jgi:hypothetical protein